MGWRNWLEEVELDLISVFIEAAKAAYSVQASDWSGGRRGGKEGRIARLIVTLPQSDAILRSIRKPGHKNAPETARNKSVTFFGRNWGIALVRQDLQREAVILTLGGNCANTYRAPAGLTVMWDSRRPESGTQPPTAPPRTVKWWIQFL